MVWESRLRNIVEGETRVRKVDKEVRKVNRKVRKVVRKELNEWVRRRCGEI